MASQLIVSSTFCITAIGAGARLAYAAVRTTNESAANEKDFTFKTALTTWTAGGYDVCEFKVITPISFLKKEFIA